MMTAYHARRCFIIRSLMLAGILTCSVSLLVLTSSNTAQEPVSTPAVGLKDYIVDDRPDWDGDQKRDLIHSYPSGRVGKAKDVASARGGEVFIHSYLKELGRGNQELIYKLEGLQPGDHFGAVVLSPGDLNLDGLDDLIISAPDHREDDAEAATSAGQVYVMHGRHPDALDLARIDEQNNTIPAPLIQGTDHILVSHSQFVYERFGTQLGIISDADEDGLTDIRVRSEVKLPDGTVTTYTTFFSGATGKPLRTVNGPGEVILWEQIPGDLNQDGLVDMEDLQNVIEAMSGASDPRDDPWGDASSGRSALPRGDVNGDGVIDHNDMLVTLANMDHNRFKFLFPSMRGIDDTGREAARAGQDPCPRCGGTCVCACFLHFPGSDFHCCCNGELVCGFCLGGDPDCCGSGGPGPDDDDDDDDDECTHGNCILTMPCDFVRLGGAPVTLNATYTAEGRPDPCGDQWKVEYPSSVRVRRNGAFIFSGSLHPFPIGSLTVEGVTVSNACNDVTITFTVLNGGVLECEASTTATVYDFDVDVDSNNDGTGVGVRMHDALDTIFPGQLVPLASGDSDSDGVPDWADGMKRWTDPVDPLRFVTSGASLTPMLVYVRPRCAEMKLTFNYFFESDPSFAGLGPPLESATPPADFSTIARPPDRTRLWSTDIDGSRHWQPLTTPPGPGTFIPAGSTYAATLLGDLVYIEGINPPSELFIIDLTFTGATCSDGDLVVVTVSDDIVLDLDIDSDNNNGFGPPDRSAIEDQIEDDAFLPGKLIGANRGNIDLDSIPDFADGFDLDGLPGTDDDVLEGHSFTPIIIDLGVGINPGAFSLAFSYDSSAPSDITVDGSNFQPTPGRLRLWTKDAWEVRNSGSVSAATVGDYVPPGTHNVQDLGFDSGTGTITLYAEGIDVSTPEANDRILVTLVPDGGLIIEDAARYCVYDIEYLTFDDETLEVRPADSVAGPSNLSPELTFTITDSRLMPGGALEIDIEGHVKDRLSELADDPAQRLQEVRFYVNGVQNSAITNLPVLSPGSGVMPWQPYLLDVDFSTTLTIDLGRGFIRPGGYVIQALTSPNAAGRTAKDTAFVTVQWQISEDLFQAPVTGQIGLTMQFTIPPTDVIRDWATVYFGDRNPGPTDGIVSELLTEPDSLLFEGELRLGAATDISIVPCTIQIEGPVNFTSQQIDSFDATVTYFFEDGLEYSTTAIWLETAADSLRFIQTTPLAPNAVQIGDDPFENPYFLPVITMKQDDFDLEPEGHQGFMDRTLVRISGLGENTDPSIFTGLVNGVPTPLAPFTFSPPYHYFINDQQQGRPRIFVVTIDNLPPGVDAVVPDNLLISDETILELRYELRINGHNPNMFIETELFEDDFGTSSQVDAPPSGPVTLPVLLTYFQLLYGDTGLDLLQMFQDGGGAILLKDVFGDLDVDYWTASAPNTMEIEIEEDIDPITAASLLWAGLRRVLPLQPMQSQMDPLEDLDIWIESMRQRAVAASEVTVAAANIYIAGITIISEGADWALTINELSDGHWEAAIGFLPFISATLPAAGRVVIRSADDVLATFDAPIVAAIKNAAAQSTFTLRWQALSQINLSHSVRVALLKGRFIKPPKSMISRNMLDEGIIPSTTLMKPQAHHRIPQVADIRENCARVGINVDDAKVDGFQIGRWVEGSPHGPHQNWSKAHLDGWRAWFQARTLPNGTQTWTREEVLGAIELLDNFPAEGPWTP